MISVKAKYRWGAALVLGLVLLGTLAQARSLDSREEAALFSLTDLGPVDLSPKTVTVEVYVAPDEELADCRRMLAQVWEQVQQLCQDGTSTWWRCRPAAARTPGPGQTPTDRTLARPAVAE